MDEAEIIRHKLDMINRNSVYGLYPAYSSEIAKIVHSYLERGITCEYDIMNCPEPPIYIGPVKVKTLKERLEEIKMKTTSVQTIKNVRDMSFKVENDPVVRESKLIIVATTDDDIFAFEFESRDLLQICNIAGMFAGLEKDQKLCEMKIKNKELEEEYEKKLSDLQSKYDLERAANEAQHKFFRQYAGSGVEIEFNYAIDEAGEVSYVIVDKEKYESLKDRSYTAIIHGKRYNPVQIVDMIHGLEASNKNLTDRIKELEQLKTPTIENFEEPSSRRDILKAAEKCVCGQREQDYGTPESNFQLIADLWNGYLFPSPKENKEVISPVDVSMMMTLMKIARIRNGGGSGDSFVDLAGYAACGGEIWYGRKKQIPEGE